MQDLIIAVAESRSYASHQIVEMQHCSWRIISIHGQTLRITFVRMLQARMAASLILR